MSNKGFYHEGVEETKQAYRIARAERSLVRKRRYELYHGRRKGFMRYVVVEFQLYRGEEKFPRTRMMTGRDMGFENRMLRMKFIKRLDKNEDAVLWQWRFVDYHAFSDMLRDCVNGLVKYKQLPSAQNEQGET